MTVFRQALAVLVLTLGAAAPAAAEVNVTESTRYYAISGRDGLEVSKAMLSGGARNISLRHAIAATSTRFQIGNADVGIVKGRCVVRDITVRLQIEYLYPQWATKDGASPAVRRAWDRFYVELVKHEKTHGRYAKEAAALLEREIKKVRGDAATGCSDFPAKADRRFDELTRQLKAKQLAFDARENRKSSKISKLQIALLRAR